MPTVKLELVINNITPAKAFNIKADLEKLAENISSDNLSYLASLSQKPDINKKLETKKTLINLYL